MKKNILLLIPFILIIGFKIKCQINTSLVKFIDYPKIKSYKAQKKKNSSIFQGNKKTRRYFEGWYFKMVSKDEKSILSVIPGISISDDGGFKHAFIQIINGKTAETEYINFSIDDFYFSKDDFLHQQTFGHPQQFCGPESDESIPEHVECRYLDMMPR